MTHMIFKHRRLFCIALFAILSVFFADLLPHAWRGLAFYLFAFAAIVLLAVSFRVRRLFFVALSLLLAALAVLSVYGVREKREALTEAVKESPFFTVTVLSPEEGYLVFLKDGERERVRVAFETDFPAEIGDTLYGPGSCILAEEGGYLASRGIFGTVRFTECRRVGTAEGFLYTLGKWRAHLTERVKEALPGEGGALLSALILGVREGLPSDFERDMTRIGTTHMLSLSGMHLVVLTAGLAYLLKLLRLRKHLRLLLLALFSVFFMILTGLSTSLLRAGMMFLFSLLPIFLREERDSLTSLSVAVACICLCEPYAIYDLSLWLSALSTLGILLLFDRYRQKNTPATVPKRILRALLLSLSITVAATVATLPLTLVAFETLPLLSPLANLLLSPLIQAALYLSVFAALLGSVPFLTPIYSFICNLIFTITGFLGDIPNSVISMKAFPVSHIFFLLFALLLGYFVFCPRKKFRFRVPIALCLVFAFVTVGFIAFDTLWQKNALSVSYRSDESAKSDALLLKVRGKELLAVFSDQSSVSHAEKDALALCAYEVDGLLLPFYSEKTPEYVEELLSDNKVASLYLPAPSSALEEEIYQAVIAIASKEGVKVLTYSDAPFSALGVTVSAFSDALSGEVSATFSADGARVTYGLSSRNGNFPAESAALAIIGSLWADDGSLLPREDMPFGNIVLCSSLDVFPFDDPRGVIFASEYHTSIPLAP